MVEGEGGQIDHSQTVVKKNGGPDRKTPIPRDDLLILDRVTAADGPLKEVFPDLKRSFLPYWGAQLSRMKSEHAEPIMGIDTAFAKEMEFFSLVTNKVKQTVDEQPGRPVVVLFDVDETAGRIPDTAKRIRLPGFEQVPYEELKPEQKAQLRQLQAEQAYEHLQLRPGLAVTVNYLKDQYGDKVQFGMLTTKAQKGMDNYVLPQLDMDAFDQELIMSCTDGAAKQLIPEVVPLVLEAAENRTSLPFAQAMEAFSASLPEDSTVLPERIVSGNEGYFTEYDLKLLMMVSMLESLRREGHEQLRKDPTALSEAEQEEWLHLVNPEAAIMLVDDAEQEALLPHDSLKSLQVPRFRLPDDYY